MDKEKIFKVANDVENASNKDLITAENALKEEFEKTKELIIDLTRHLDIVGELFEKVNIEYNKRLKGI